MAGRIAGPEILRVHINPARRKKRKAAGLLDLLEIRPNEALNSSEEAATWRLRRHA
jgi:hypothetical protein